MRWLLFITGTLFVFLSVSCSDRPDGVPKSKEMVEVLLDYHIADAMAMQKGDNTAFSQQIYTDAALKKHGLTREQFHQSLQYYERHTTKLLAIYQHVEMRLAELAPGANVGAVTTDSAENIWNGKPSYVLMSNQKNRLTFEMAPPKNVKSGCRLEWNFNVQWLYREGNRTADVLLVLVYEGDSVVTQYQQLFGSGKQKVSVYVGDKPLKSIKGLIYQDARWSAKPKILYLSSVALYIRNEGVAKQKNTNAMPQEPQSLRVHRNDSAAHDSGTTRIPGNSPATPPAAPPATAPDFVNNSGTVSKRALELLDSAEKKDGRDQPHFK